MLSNRHWFGTSRRWALRGLFTKFLSVMVPVFLLVAVPGLSVLVHYELNDKRAALAARMGNQSARVADALTRHNVSADPVLARDLLASLAADRAFLCAEYRSRTDHRLLAAAPPRLGCVGQSGNHQLTLPVGDDENAILIVHFSDAEIENALKLRRSLMISVLALAFLSAVIAAVLGFGFIITRPLRRLLIAIRQAHETGKREPIENPGNDELGRVINAFNEMLERETEREAMLENTNQALRGSQRDFQELNKELEARIRARTGELKEREAALFESESRFRDFADASSDWYWEMDEDLRFSYFSDRFTAVTGVAPERLLGKTREETGVPNVDPEQWRRHLDALHNHKPFRTFIHPRVKDSGETVWLSISGVPYYDEYGRFKGFRGTGNDITDLIEAERQAELARREAEDANHAKSEFLANMSHELRTPLNAIIGYAELLQEEAEDRDDPALLEDLTKVQKASKHLQGLINNVLDLSKIESSKMNVTLDQVDLLDLVTEVADTVRPLIEEGGNRFSVDNSTNFQHLITDGQKLRQTLLNLLGNAAKFTRSGDVRLEVAQTEPDGLCFTVSDTGIGMTEEQIDVIFEPFTQADTAIDRKYGGTGLGLTLCKRFTELLNGRIEVESKPGQGTRFSITLRIHQVDADGVTALTA